MQTYSFHPSIEDTRFAGIILYSEIFQLTGPIRRFATFLAGHGYLVAVPEVYHELELAGTVLAYDQAGSDEMRWTHPVRPDGRLRTLAETPPSGEPVGFRSHPLQNESLQPQRRGCHEVHFELIGS